MKKLGTLFIISGFSGAGKGTILKEVFKRVDNLKFSVSATSRAPRADEIDGVHYHFISEDRFEELIAQNAFVEHTKTFNYYYGTLKSEVDVPLSEGLNVVFDINVVGAANIKAQYPDAVTVFVTPPTLADLRRRLTNRNSETEETLARSINEAKKEVLEMEKYDFIVVNDDLDEAVSAVCDVINACGHRAINNKNIIKSLMEEEIK